MPSSFAHAAPALALIPAFATPDTPRRLWIAGVLCAAAPDLDVAGWALGVLPSGHPLAHRGLSHSIPFAAAAAVVVAWVVGCRSLRAWLYLFLAIASHGVLDAFTNGGRGIALLSPFDGTRYFAPFRPIEVSPLGIGAFFSARGIEVVESELLWVWLPFSLLAVALFFGRLGARRVRARAAL